MKDNSGRCRMEVLSLTDALKKQDILVKWAIPCEIIKIAATDGKKGCSYALEYSCSQGDNVNSALAESGGRGRRWKRN